MRFETARVCVLRRTEVAPEAIDPNEYTYPPLPPEHRPEPDFEYEVVAWPPGTVDGGLLPQVGDEITLPGYEQPFRVVERVLHWPAPSTPEARLGELQVNLAVEEAESRLLNERPWGRPGEQEIREEGRWLRGRVAQFETRDSRELDERGLPRTRWMSIAFDIPGVGRLHHFVTWAWQVRAMFGPGTMADIGDQDFADFGTLGMLLQERTEFEVRVVPDQFGSRLTIQGARPLQDEARAQVKENS